MSTREKDIGKVKNLTAGENTCYVNWYDGGGGAVHLIEDKLFLYSIPQYGGLAAYEGTFGLNEVEKLVDLAHTWN